MFGKAVQRNIKLLTTAKVLKEMRLVSKILGVKRNEICLKSWTGEDRF